LSDVRSDVEQSASRLFTAEVAADALHHQAAPVGIAILPACRFPIIAQSAPIFPFSLFANVMLMQLG
jgi:hypothetical protein